ncbi:hypothetical protein FNF29_05375 [Cafeteria roenbergensis]|uniref:SLC26A/SulP transporter domain-containing protein n=1 Tax=Cafeteria roenbergensis TaxID=33653 RepID=A0A5A8CB68_CAFRO|nr:hypothetical protein FNF29_05375 [Cafeteria roenbergensis]|eukprot:KAA0150363.1 hypothetical protein FNF29_05375 [Cafeteria roenbergensis]
MAAAASQRTRRDADSGRRRRCCVFPGWGTAGYHLMPYHPSVYVGDARQVLREVLAGLTVAFAQVSDSIAFAFIAGVGPLLGLHAAWIIGLTMSLVGSRPAMINGATGVRAAVIAPYVARLGVGYLFYIVIGAAIFQFIAAALSLTRFVRLVTRPVMIGFVCGLAIVMAIGQIRAFYVPQTEEFNDSTTILWQLFLVAIALLSMVVWPFIPAVGKTLPPPLVGIFVAMALEFGVVRAAAGHRTPVVSDLGNVNGGFPLLFWLDPQYAAILPPLTLEVLGEVWQPAFIAAAACMVEAVVTMEVANDMTGTDNPLPSRQIFALGLGNLLSGLLGTMGGGATIGPTVMACSNGANGRYRISGVVAAAALLLVILAASGVVAIIPTSALVAIMAVVCWATFDWSMPLIALAAVLPERARSCLGLRRKVRRIDALVMVTTTVLTVTVDLFTAVMIGTAISAIDYAWSRGKEVRIASELVPLEPGDELPTAAACASALPPGPGLAERATCDASASELTSPAEPPQGLDAKRSPPDALASISVACSSLGAGADPPSVLGTTALAAQGAGAAAPAPLTAAEEPPLEGLKRVYVVRGDLFFASTMDFARFFSPSVVEADPKLIEIRMDEATIRDYSGMHVLGVIAQRYHKAGKRVVLKRMGLQSFTLVSKADHLVQSFDYELERVSPDPPARPECRVEDGPVDPDPPLHEQAQAQFHA